jgi:hypothetical protein
MRRRDFMVLAIGGAAMWPRSIYAQHPQKMFRIGVLLPGTPPGISGLRRR